MSGKRLIPTALWAFTLLLAVHAQATTYTWTGAVSNLWSNQNNWNPVGVPASGDSVAFPSGAANLTNTNDLAPGTSIVAIAFNGGGYTTGGNGVVLTGSMTSSGSSVVNLPIDVQTNAVTFTTGSNLTVGGSLSGTGPIMLNGGSFMTFTGTH
ncbi:MAG: trimeric autotransporter adhesin, partial [Thermoanaerobaculia bacterium]|nr:trimeric autotransporter adhesin [Thermoanaerobaculia bacterium]